MLKKIGIGAALIVFAGVAFAYSMLDDYARIGAGYKAKLACSEIFVASRTLQAVLADEFSDINPALEKVGVKINQEKKTVSASLWGLGKSKALYREGYGCTLINGGAPAELPDIEQPTAIPLLEAQQGSDQELAHVDYKTISAILNDAFNEDDARHLGFLILVDGKVVAEKYANGFSSDTPFLSWSMAKSVTATLVGAAVQRGIINLDESPPVPEWTDKHQLAEVSWTHLLHMQDGLNFEEDYGDPSSDVIRMLYSARDTGAIAAKKKLLGKPGEIWSYSSGTTNLIARSLRFQLDHAGLDFFQFADDTILEPLGAASLVMEPDSSGTIIGSSYIYATTRDWAKLGQLYLQDGIWNDSRLLPEGWVDFVSSPSGKSDGQYGAHFWLNFPGQNERPQFIQGLPENVFVMAGHEGQYVVIIPDKNMIIVRTGRTRKVEAMKVVAPTLASLYNAVGPATGEITY